MRFIILAVCVLFFSPVGIASVLGVPPGGQVVLNPGAQVEACWMGDLSPGAHVLEARIEEYLREQLEDRAGLELKFYANCFNSMDPFFPIGLAFFDDPQTGEGVRSEIRGMVGDTRYAGHPLTFGRGYWASRLLVDVNLTSRFEGVLPALREQAAPLSPQGKENLILSIALHEFMHALGFAHEQAHRDSTCKEGEDAYHASVHTLLTAYDPLSVMNYCLTHHYDFEKGPLPLSELDVAGVVAIYGRRTSRPSEGQ